MTQTSQLDGVEISQLVDQFIACRKITHQQYLQLSAAILSDNRIDEAERYQINRLFDNIQSGRLKLVD